jgi:hypothetical protein
MKCASKTIILIMGVIFMALNIYSCSGGVKYERYSGQAAKAGFDVDYIPGWSADEQTGSLDSFFQVVFCEPAIERKGLRAMMVITVQDASKAQFTPSTIEGMAEDLIKKRMLFDSAKVLSKTKNRLSREDAIDIRMSYKTIDKPGKIGGKLVKYDERIIVLKKSEKFYKIRYGNFSKNYDKYAGAFDHFVKSIKFK